MVTSTLVVPFLLTMAVSFLVGIGLREYYEGEQKFDTFGTVRTFVFIGMLGFVLFVLPGIGPQAFLAGFGVLGLFLLAYYAHKVFEKKNAGMIGVLIALLTYATGPIAMQQPYWYLVLIAISILLVLYSKGRIRHFTDSLETGEVVTACKFLAIVAVVLPLIPEAVEAGGWVGRFIAALPVTPRQIWLAVVVTTAISYLGYVLQTYLYPRRGMLLTGLIGGIYSSTVAVLVLAKKSRSASDGGREAAAAIMFAVSMMYLRLIALTGIFRPQSLITAGPVLLVLATLAASYGLMLRTRRRLAPDATASAPGGTHEAALRRNPLELTSAFFFAVMFVLVSFATKLVLDFYQESGLRALSFVVGFSDITPFVVSILQGRLGLLDQQILQAIIIASASNNVLKTVYTYAFGTRKTAVSAGTGMLSLAALAVAYALLIL